MVPKSDPAESLSRSAPTGSREGTVQRSLAKSGKKYMEVEAHKALLLHQLDLESRQETLVSSAPVNTGMSSSTSSPLEEFESEFR